jgi:cytochrome c oxidase subunit 2
MLHIDRYERLFIGASFILIVVFALALFVGGVAGGIDVPAPYMRVDPKTVETDPSTPFSLPPAERVFEVAPGKYEAYIIAQLWKFVPGTDLDPSRVVPAFRDGAYQVDPIRVPKGSTVTFHVTSKDIQHGVKIIGTNISFMVLPGQVSRLTATFDKPGTYTMVCYEYCGLSHHLMYGEILVTD